MLHEHMNMLQKYVECTVLWEQMFLEQRAFKTCSWSMLDLLLQIISCSWSMLDFECYSSLILSWGLGLEPFFELSYAWGVDLATIFTTATKNKDCTKCFRCWRHFLV